MTPKGDLEKSDFMQKNMDIHILGICGTFMGGVAVLARQAGFNVSGADANVYPPMSTQLREQGIELIEGYDSSFLEKNKMPVVIGNAMSRGNPVVEYILDEGVEYCSGPQWLAENVLLDKWVLAVSGTHGKTTTSSMLAWILEYAGLKPGFLIGGIPENFGVSARLGESDFFVVEADEYDTAFFDKRSKFVHYKPNTLIINNIEFDHADIFPDLAAIQRQFHHLVRIVPSSGVIITKNNCINIDGVLQQGCWTPVQKTAISASVDNGWSAENVSKDGSHFDICFDGKKKVSVSWQLQGLHNIENGLSAVAAAAHVGVSLDVAVDALSKFVGVKRRMEACGTVNGITVYDDFAHHPTAIKLTVNGLRAKVGKARVIAVFEPRSNTMKMGVHKDELLGAFSAADQTYMLKPQGLQWDLPSGLNSSIYVKNSVEEIVVDVVKQAEEGDHTFIMSNGAFGGIHQKIIDSLKEKINV